MMENTKSTVSVTCTCPSGDGSLRWPCPQHGAPSPGARNVDDIVTALYRRFKDWSKRGFGADDVTWCEVKADVLEIIAQQGKEVQHTDTLDANAQLDKMWKARFLVSQALHNVMVGNQSAWIEWRHGAGAEAAMAWIHNGLVGPGLIPTGTDAQAWFDANQDDRYEIPGRPEAKLQAAATAASKEGGAA